MVAREVLSKLDIFKVVGTGLVSLNPFEPVASSSTVTEGDFCYTPKKIWEE